MPSLPLIIRGSDLTQRAGQPDEIRFEGRRLFVDRLPNADDLAARFEW